MSVALSVYRAAWSAGVGLGLPGLLLRGRPEERDERLARGGPLAPGSVWVHAASLGEMVPAETLVGAIRRRQRIPIAVTAMTRTGKERAVRMAPEVGPLHLPLDAPRVVARFLDRLRPRAMIVLETELWPNLLTELAERGIPWAIASGRLSRRSERRLRPVRGLFRRLLSSAAAIAARTPEDGDRFVALGARPDAVRVTGDLKEDVPLSPWTPAPEVPAWIAACTRPGEEEDVLDALQRVAEQVPDGELILAPRHPERFAEVGALVRQRGWPVRPWADRDRPAPLSGWRVLLVDQMGVLGEAYRRAGFAFVGGSLRPFRGHSPLEAAAAGRAVAMGPHTGNCEDAARRLADAGALVRVDSSGALAELALSWIGHPAERERRGRAGWKLLQDGGGIADRTVAFLGERGVLP